VDAEREPLVPAAPSVEVIEPSPDGSSEQAGRDHAGALEARSGAGRAIITASYAGTGVYVVAAVVATIVPDGFGPALAAVSLMLFAAGMVVFLWSYAVAVGRSRVDAIGIGGLYFLSGSAPRSVRVRLLGALAIEVVVAIASASVRPFTALAFGVLVPVFGLGLAGLWGARHGVFDPR